MGALNIAAMYLEGLPTYGFIIILLGMGWMVAAGVGGKPPGTPRYAHDCRKGFGGFNAASWLLHLLALNKCAPEVARWLR